MPNVKMPVQGSLFGDEVGFLPEDKPPSLTSQPDHIGPTAVTYAPFRDILTRATGFMDAYDYTLNPYSGCSFGCTYCYAAFFSRDITKQESWGYWVTVKENAVALLKKRKPGSLDGKRIYISSVTDPYQPVEKHLELTRQLLKVMAEHHKPKLVVQTRSPTVVRDINLYRKIEESGGRVQINMTVTTDDESIRSTFEPFCPSNPVRLEAIGEIQAAGLDTCITMTPVLLVNDKHQFTENLVATGVKDFIAQPFHFRRGRFLAGTREQALDLMAEKLGCGRKDFVHEYEKRYREFFLHLKKELQDRGLPELGEGKEGFRPPF
ncbi:MAG: radical SAM protein [Caldilineaceae bacterium]|nr:radical SAM protein [Caldilineaceae bacterium]